MIANRPLFHAMGACAVVLTAGCTASGLFPAIEFPEPPQQLAKDPSGAVVLESVGTIEFRGASENPKAPGPRTPHVVVRRRLRAIVTGEVDIGLREWRFLSQPNVTIDLARARLARPGGEVHDIDGLAGGSAQEVTMSLPGPQPGDLIDVVWEKTFLVPETLPPWVFATPAPTVESRVEVISPPGWEVQLVLGQGSEINRGADVDKRERSDGALIKAWTEHNIRPVPSEPGAVDAQRSSPWATAVLVKAMVGGETVAYADSWKTVSSRLKAALAATMEVDEETRQSMAVGLAKARLRALRRTFRPVSVTGGPLDRVIRPFAELKESGGATPLEAAAITSVVTADAIEKGYIALVAPFEGPVLLDNLPGLYAFRAAAVAFKTGDGWDLVDIACGSCEFGKVPLELAGGRALILADEPVLHDIPLRAVETNRRRLQFDWVVSVAGELTGSVSVDLEGVAVREARAAMAADDDAARLAGLSNLLLRPESGTTVDFITKESRLQPGEPYRLKLKVSTTAIKKGDAHFEVTPAMLGGVSLPWPYARTRRTAALLPAPSRVEVTCTLQLPPFFKAELPPPIKERLPIGEYVSEFELHGRVITYTRRVGLFARSVPVERYGDLAALFAKMEQADARILTIKGED